MIRFKIANDYIDLSPLEIADVFIINPDYAADFTQTKPYKDYSICIETSGGILQFRYKILSNLFQKFETEFSEGILDDICDFIEKYTRVYEKHEPTGHVKLDLDGIVSRNLNKTISRQINAVSNSSIVIEGIDVLDPEEVDEYLGLDNEYDSTEDYDDIDYDDIDDIDDSEESEEIDIESELTPLIRKIIKDILSDSDKRKLD